MSLLVGPGASAPLVIAGLRDRYAIAIAVGVLLLAVVVAVLRKRRGPRLELRSLDAAERRRYADQFAATEATFETRPQIALGQARGLVEEVLRRMGFPDRIDTTQRARDLAAHDRQAAVALEAADREVRQGGADPEAPRRALQSYRQVLDRLLGTAPES